MEVRPLPFSREGSGLGQHGQERSRKSKGSPQKYDHCGAKALVSCQEKPVGSPLSPSGPLGTFHCRFLLSHCQLVVELDGTHHDLKEEKGYDNLREEHLKARGVKVIRFKNNEVLMNTSSVLVEIQKQIKSSITSKIRDNPSGH